MICSHGCGERIPRQAVTDGSHDARCKALHAASRGSLFTSNFHNGPSAFDHFGGSLMQVGGVRETPQCSRSFHSNMNSAAYERQCSRCDQAMPYGDAYHDLVCPKFLLTCEACGGQYPRSAHIDHYAVCTERTAPCECCGAYVQAVKLASHVAACRARESADACAAPRHSADVCASQPTIRAVQQVERHTTVAVAAPKAVRALEAVGGASAPQAGPTGRRRCESVIVPTRAAAVHVARKVTSAGASPRACAPAAGDVAEFPDVTVREGAPYRVPPPSGRFGRSAAVDAQPARAGGAGQSAWVERTPLPVVECAMPSVRKQREEPVRVTMRKI